MKNRKERFKVKENIRIRTICNITGEVLEERLIHNLITNVGLNDVANYIANNAPTGYENIAIGEGTTSPVAGDTELDIEVTREAATTVNVTGAVVSYSHEFIFGTGEAYDIAEVGLVNSLTVTGSKLFNRATFAPVSVDTNISLIVDIDITMADA